MVTQSELHKKMGCTIEQYVEIIKNKTKEVKTEDDSWVSPLSKLSIEELDYIADYVKKNKLA
ncbi:MAG: hypothetical protein K2M73_10510 [Lachnospiraceae bacterium]|nr:hypothetical protein [Lachnospiraceae bacterium]